MITGEFEDLTTIARGKEADLRLRIAEPYSFIAFV